MYTIVIFLVVLHVCIGGFTCAGVFADYKGFLSPHVGGMLLNGLAGAMSGLTEGRFHIFTLFCFVLSLIKD